MPFFLLWSYISTHKTLPTRHWLFHRKATGNSRSGIPGNSRESRNPKFPAGIPGNF